MKRLLAKIENKAESFRALRQAAIDLVKAEGAALSLEFGGSGRSLMRAVVLILIALFVFFWALGVTVFLAMELLALRYPRWGGALIVLTVLLGAGALLVVVGWRRIKRIDTPKQTVRRRLADHNDWWSEKFGKTRHRARETVRDRDGTSSRQAEP